MEKILALAFAQVLKDEGMRNDAAQALAEFLVNQLPDVTVEVALDFLREIADKLG